MTGRTHDLAAISVLGAVVLFEPARTITLSTALVAILANQIGGILPDIDQPTAPLWKNLPEGKWFGKLFDKSLGGHRFLTHSIIGAAIFAGLARLLLNFLHPVLGQVNTGLVWWAFAIGLISHLIMDSFTKEGVPWLLPWRHKFGFPPLKAWRVTTGKSVEMLVIFPAILILDIWLCASHYHELLVLIHQHLT
jgi:inner membrane protein